MRGRRRQRTLEARGEEAEARERGVSELRLTPWGSAADCTQARRVGDTEYECIVHVRLLACARKSVGTGKSACAWHEKFDVQEWSKELSHVNFALQYTHFASACVLLYATVDIQATASRWNPPPLDSFSLLR